MAILTIDELSDELDRKTTTIQRLRDQITIKDRIIADQNCEIYRLKCLLDRAKAEVDPLRDSLNSLTAEHGKVLRRLKRETNSTKR